MLFYVLTSKSFLTLFFSFLSLSLGFAMARAYTDANLGISIVSQDYFSFCSTLSAHLFTIIPDSIFSFTVLPGQLFFTSFFVLFLFFFFLTLSFLESTINQLLKFFLEITKLIVLRLICSSAYFI